MDPHTGFLGGASFVSIRLADAPALGSWLHGYRPCRNRGAFSAGTRRKDRSPEGDPHLGCNGRNSCKSAFEHPIGDRRTNPVGTSTMTSVSAWEVAVARSRLPPLQAMSTTNPPRALRPLTWPSGHAWGNAGRTRRTPPWDCSNISAMAAVAPRFPSIWNTVRGLVPPGGDVSRSESDVLTRSMWSRRCTA